MKKMAKGKSSVGKRSIATRDIGNSNFYEDGPAVTSGKMPKSGKPKGKK